MLRSSPDLEHVLDQIESLLGQLEDPTIDKSLVKPLFTQVSSLFDRMIELHRRTKVTPQ